MKNSDGSGSAFKEDKNLRSKMKVSQVSKKKQKKGDSVDANLLSDAQTKFQENLSLLSTQSSLLNLDFNDPQQLLAGLGLSTTSKKTKTALDESAGNIAPLFLKRAEMIRQRNTAPGRGQTLLVGKRNLLG